MSRLRATTAREWCDEDRLAVVFDYLQATRSTGFAYQFALYQCRLIGRVTTNLQTSFSNLSIQRKIDVIHFNREGVVTAALSDIFLPAQGTSHYGGYWTPGDFPGSGNGQALSPQRVRPGEALLVRVLQHRS
jgi:hypothetical protein